MKHWLLRNFIFRYHYKDIDAFGSGYTADPITLKNMEEWINSEFGPKRARILITRDYYCRGIFGARYPVAHFCFKNKEDLMACKLKWM